jgi:hypothetical protein
MPRLEGKRSNSGLYIVLLIIVLLIVLLAVDYLNLVNLIPNFGPA